MVDLIWDSQFFGKKIGKIAVFEKNEGFLEASLARAYTEKYELIYVFTEKNIEVSDEILQKFHGKLVDRKVTYTAKIAQLQTKNRNHIEEFLQEKASQELYDLAYLSGSHSRFKLDNGFGIENFKRLYREWVNKSVSHAIARKVFVYSNKKIGGMVTLNVKEETATIGLIAVDETLQGQGIGASLIDACVEFCKNEKIQTLDVPTQMDNLQACRFYEKYGFEIKEINNIYHFWQ
ncbi:GNAT family N-acetyltransferase [Emticicia sp. SJ17W-69]|uniref:GNAT family N-acetyltransferase n=1 Tax=Emticicia sp. SJ17W-69 TaxID=3421657 RepID=UPI003EBB59F0